MFHNYMNLKVEVKKAEGEEGYEPYDPNWQYLRVLKYVEGESYDFKNLDKLPT